MNGPLFPEQATIYKNVFAVTTLKESQEIITSISKYLCSST